MTPPLTTIESIALDLSSALLTARNAAPKGTPAHAARQEPLDPEGYRPTL